MKFRFQKCKSELKNKLVEVSFWPLFSPQNWFLKHIGNGRDIYGCIRQRVKRSRLSQSILNLYEEPEITLLNTRKTAERTMYRIELRGQIRITGGQVLKLILKWVTGSVWQNDVIQFLCVCQCLERVWSSLRSIRNINGARNRSSEREYLCNFWVTVSTVHFSGVFSSTN